MEAAPPEQVGMVMGDRRLPDKVSVTTVAKAVVGMTGDGLLNWAWRQGRSGIPLHAASQGGRDRGNAVHKALEDYYKTGTLPDPLAYPSDQRPYVDGLLAWLHETNPAIRGMEVALEDRELRVTGRIDLIRECTGCANCRDRLGVVPLDVKSGGADLGPPDRSAHLQVGGGYRHLHAVNSTRTTICGAEILRLASTGKHKVFAALYGPEAFLRALAWYRDLATVPDPFAFA